MACLFHKGEILWSSLSSNKRVIECIKDILINTIHGDNSQAHCSNVEQYTATKLSCHELWQAITNLGPQGIIGCLSAYFMSFETCKLW